jgi:hypothetical protein
MRKIWLLTIILMLGSCTPWRTQYLEEVTGLATQDEVTMRLGPPTGERTLSNSDLIWMYRYTGADVGPNGGSTWCREYILRFDTKRILRGWNRQKC